MKRIGLAILGLSAGLLAQENPAFWPKYKVITVNTKASGANVVNTVGKFPVLVRLNATNANDVFTEAKAGGADIRFGNAAGTAFRPYQIESWDATAKTASIWVLTDSVKGNDSVAALRLYWGRASTNSASNGAAVFDTANGFVSVWHMNGSTTETSATAHGFVATPFGTPTSGTGAIGGGRVLNGTSQYFQALGSASSAMSFAVDSSYTFSAWVKADSISTTGNNTGHAIVTKGDHQWALAIFGGTAPNRFYEITTKAGNNGWRQTTTAGTTTPAYVGDTANTKVGVWRYVTGSWTGTPLTTATGRIYTDGVLQKTTTFDISNNPNTSRSTARDVHIGVLSNEGPTSTNATGTLQRYFKGTLDEITISRGLRDSNWVKLSYETQKANAAAVTLLATQTQTVPATVAITNPYYVIPYGTGANAPRDTMNFTYNVPVNVALKFNGGPSDSVAITTGTLPAGLTVDKFTGTLSGTPTAAAAAGNLTLTIYASTGTVTRGLRIAVAPGPLVLTKYTQDTAAYATGVPVSNAPVFSTNGRSATKVKVTSGTLPAGLKIDTVSGVISGTPTALSAAANYTVTAYNATDSSSRVIRLSVADVSTENYSTGWSVHKDIWLNTQGNGAATVTGVSKFPVLVRLTSDFVGTGTQPLANGADIRFTKADNTTRLPHEIESWDAATKTGAVWVRLDTIKPLTKEKFVMHWGNASAPSVSSGPSVFDTAAGFQAVWHLNGTTDEADATLNGFTAVAAGAPTTGVGAIGPARVFNGTSQFFQVPNSASGVLNFQQTQSYTLSAWINPSFITAATSGAGHKIIDKGDNQYVLATYGDTPETRYWEITTKGNNTWNQCQANGSLTGSTPIPASTSLNSWNHLVGIYTGAPVGGSAMQRLYYNGKLVSECPLENTDATGRTETVNVHLGVQSGASPSGTYTRHWQGSMDEPRLANKARSADWVKLEYHNQKMGGTNNLVSFTEPTAIGAMASMAAQGLFFKSMNDGIQFQVAGLAAGEKATLSLVDAFGRTVFSSAFQGDRLNWNGRANNGHEISAGVYVARVKVFGADGRASKVLEHRVPFTR